MSAAPHEQPIRRICWSSGQIGYLHVFALALVFRLAYLTQAWMTNPLIDVPIIDARAYFIWAQQVLDGQFLWPELQIYTPVYPYFLALCFGIVGNNLEMVFVLFGILGALNAVTIGKIAESVWDRPTGVIAGMIAALFWPLVLFEATLHAETLTVWSLCCGILFFL